jgi:hypothetical protein
VAANPLLFHGAVVSVELSLGWVAFAVLLFSGDLLAAGSRGAKLSLAGLFLFALLLRWSLASRGPGDLHLNLASIWSTAPDLPWGQAPIALFRMLGFFTGTVRDTHIIWCNLLLGSVAPILLYALLVGLGVDRVAALSAALVAAAHPLLIVFSGVLERQPVYLFAAFGSMVALIGYLERGGWARFAAFVLGTVLATTSRPEGAQVLVLHVAALLFVPGRRRERAVAMPALGILMALAFVHVRQIGLSSTGGTHAHSDQLPFLWTVLFSADFTPAAWIVAWVLGLVLGVRRPAAGVALAALIGLHVVWSWTGIYDMFVGIERQVASARYESILLVPFAIGIGLLVESFAPARPWLKICVLGVVLISTGMTLRRPYEVLLRPFTVDYEYHFLRKHALSLPRQSQVYILDSPNDDDGFYDANHVGEFVNSAVRFRNWRERDCDDLRRSVPDSYLYIGSSCAEQVDHPLRHLMRAEHARWIEQCSRIRARVVADAVEERDVPAHKMAWHDFTEKSVRLGLYRLTDASICDLGPVARSKDGATP